MAKKKEQTTKESGISEIIGRIISTGIGAAFITEDTIRNILSDLPLPKSIVTGLLENAKSAKADFANLIKSELQKHLSKGNIKRLLQELLDQYDIKIDATLHFKKKRK